MHASNPPDGTVTQLLRRLSANAPDATDRLFEVVYPELRRLAAKYLSLEHNAFTLQPTALVNEAYLKLIDQDDGWEGRAHFLGVAARAMRQVLVDAARARNAAKRGGGARPLPLDHDRLAESPVTLDQALDLDDALTKLAAVHERPARVAELRYFAEMTIGEVALVLGTSHATVESDWAFAKAWLHRALSRDTDE